MSRHEARVLSDRERLIWSLRGVWRLECTCGFWVSTPEHDAYELQDLMDAHWAENLAPDNGKGPVPG